MSVCTPWADVDTAPCDAGSFPEGILARAVAMANALIDRATLGMYGVCEDVIRPCSEAGMVWSSAGGYVMPTWSATGDVAGWGCGCTGNGDVRPCACSDHRGLVLPHAPVRRPAPASLDELEVLIDGVPVDDVVIVDASIIMRGDGLSWPCCQHLERDPSEIGTWQVTYPFGADVPDDGVMAVGSLGCEFAKAWTGGTGCRLPRRVTSVVSEGVTVAMALDTLDVIREGWFGIPEVDGFIASVNPNRLTRQPRWFSVDTLAEGRRIT